MLYRENIRKPSVQSSVPAQEPLGLADVLAFINSAKWPGLICTTLLGALATYYVFSVQPMYTALANVYLQNQKGLVIAKEANGAIPMDVGEIETQMEVIRSQRVADEVLRTVDLEPYMPLAGEGQQEWLKSTMGSVMEWVGLTSKPPETDTPELAREKQKYQLARQGLLVRRPGLSFTVEVSYTAHDPQLAALLANAYAQAYIQERKDQRRDAIKQATSWMEERASQLRQQAEEAFAAAEEYREANIGVRSTPNQDTPPMETPEQRRVKLKQLESAAQTLQRTYETFFERLAELTQQQSAPGIDAIILNEAGVPTSPSYPKKKLTILLALIAGAGLGATVTLLHRIFSRSLGTPSQLRSLGIPFFGSVPGSPSRCDKTYPVVTPHVLTSRGTLDQSRRQLTVSNVPSPYRAVINAPDCAFSQSVRNLKVELELAGLGQEIRTLGVLTLASTQAASIATSNLAHLFALQGSAMLLDADVSNPHLSQVLVPSARSGLAGVVSSSTDLDEVLAEDQETGLAVLPCEDNQVRPDIKLSAASPQRLTQLFETARLQADIILVNLAQIHFATTKAILPHLDGILIIAEEKKTRLTDLLVFANEIKARGGHVLGFAVCETRQRARRFEKRRPSQPMAGGQNLPST